MSEKATTIGRDNIKHIYPVSDLKPHNTDSGAMCKCEPVTEISTNSVTVIHNAYDGRELFETKGLDC